jgi:hypothetical protein
MKKLQLFARISIALLGSLAFSQNAGAVVDFCDVALFPLCDQHDFGTCQFDIDYGNTGTVRANGILWVDGQGALNNTQIEPQTDLTLGCSVSGTGTSAMKVSITFTNDGVAASPNLTYFAFTNPDGNAISTNLGNDDVPEAFFLEAGSGNWADNWGTDEKDSLNSGVPGNIFYEISTSGQLSNSNYCGSFCDTIVSLQWDIGSLLPGESMRAVVFYSDDGSRANDNYVTISRADENGVKDDPGTVLTMSGFIGPPPPSVPIASPLTRTLIVVCLVAGGGLLLRPRHGKFRV